MAQRSLGYFYMAPGGMTSSGVTTFTVQAGAGGEVALRKGITLGIEGGVVGPQKEYFHNLQGEGSLNGYYHFYHSRDSRWDPFVTAGYSMFFRHDIKNLANFGGGFNYWFGENVAFRCEFRDQVQGSPTAHFWGARVGLSFTRLSP